MKKRDFPRERDADGLLLTGHHIACSERQCRSPPVTVFKRVASEEFTYMQTFDDNTFIILIITIALYYLFKMTSLSRVLTENVRV